MSEGKVNCLKCKSSMNKKPGLWICDSCYQKDAVIIRSVSFDKESQDDIFKERFLANRGLDKEGNLLETEMVNHPSHYNQGSIEVIDAIEDWNLDFRLGNAIKYLARAGKKNNEVKQDLEKAIWYIKRYIDKECL